jgi:hypothetical protein
MEKLVDIVFDRFQFRFFDDERKSSILAIMDETNVRRVC